MDVTRSEFDDLVKRVDRHDEAIMTLQRGYTGLIDDIYGDPAKRSGPASLFERFDRLEESITRRFDEQAALIQQHDAQIRQWLGWQHLLAQLVTGIVNWSFLGRARRALGVFGAVVGGAALGGLLFAIILAVK